MDKIPEHARKVFQGIIFDVYHWEQELFDGSKATFEVIKRLPSVQIIAVTKNKKIILLKEEQPHVGSFLSVPGGQMERGQTPEETARLELLQELGAKCDKLKLWKNESLGAKIIWESYWFIAKDCEIVGEQKLEPGERIESYEVSFEDFFEEVDKKEFRNKHLSEVIFRIRHTPGELEKFKELLFE